MSMWNEHANGRDEHGPGPLRCPYCGASDGHCVDDSCWEEENAAWHVYQRPDGDVEWTQVGSGIRVHYGFVPGGAAAKAEELGGTLHATRESFDRAVLDAVGPYLATPFIRPEEW